MEGDSLDRPLCDGTGQELKMNNHVVDCSGCGGSGHIDDVREGVDAIRLDCTSCGGTGCLFCHDRGYNYIHCYIDPAKSGDDQSTVFLVHQGDSVTQHIDQVAGYETLHDVLSDAYDQASKGKGKDRHAQDLPFNQQPMQQVAQLVGIGFPLGQAIKKVQEAQRLPYERARAELLGAINYIAGAIIYLDNDR